MSDKSRRAPERIADIREAMVNARHDIGLLTKAQFLDDGKTQRAVIESIIVAGEAANSVMHLVPSIELNHPETWQQLRDAYAMRILLTHEYFRVDAGVVWDTVMIDFPKFEQLLVALAPGP